MHRQYSSLYFVCILSPTRVSLFELVSNPLTCRWFARYVISAILMDKNNRYSHITSFVPFTIVTCVFRDWLQTTYLLNFQEFKGILGITWALQKVNFASFYPKELHSSDINRKPCENKYILKHHAKLRGQQMQTTVWH